MVTSAQKIKEKMLEFSQLFSIEQNRFQKFVIVYRYIHFLKTNPLAKDILQKIFNDTAVAISEESFENLNEEKFIDIKEQAVLSREFWIYYNNLEIIYGHMKKLRKAKHSDKDNHKLFAKLYSNQILKLSFKVVNSEVFDRLDKECFFSCDDESNKTYFDNKNSVLYVRGVKVKINKQSQTTNAHKILHHIFITNKNNLDDDFYYSEIAEDEFHELEYRGRKNNWRKYARACQDINNKVREQNKEKEDFLKFNTGSKGKIKVNKKYF